MSDDSQRWIYTRVEPPKKTTEPPAAAALERYNGFGFPPAEVLMLTTASHVETCLNLTKAVGGHT